MKDGLRVMTGLMVAVALPFVVHPNADASLVRGAAGGGCAPTAEAAVQRYVAGAVVSGDEGFRVVSLHKDALRARTWAVVERCNRPEVPLLSLPIAADGAALGSLPVVAAMTAVSEAAVVRAGDAVVVRQGGSASRMELHGWAEESGKVGAKVRVRLPRISEGEDGAAPRILCNVVGGGQVEVAQ